MCRLQRYVYDSRSNYLCMSTQSIADYLRFRVESARDPRTIVWEPVRLIEAGGRY